MSKHKHKPPKTGTPNNVVQLLTAGNGQSSVAAAREAYDRGMRLRERNQLDGSAKAFHEAIAADPHFVDALNDLGLTLVRQNNLSEAMSQFKRALELRPDHPHAQNNLGVLWLRLGNHDEAIPYFERAARAAPHLKAIHANLEIARRERDAARRHTFAASPAPHPDSSADRPTITLCLIAKNEAAYLPKLFESAREAVDEIVLVDTGSTDDTVAIGKSFNAKVVRYEWRADFAAAKNEALKHATGQWVLFLDGDMAIEEGGAAKIQAAVASGIAGAYNINIHSPLADGVSEDIVAQPWLFQNAPGVEWEGAIHERILPSLQAAGLQPAHTDVVVYHFGYASREAVQRRASRNFAALRQRIESGWDNPIAHYYLGTTLITLSRPAEAIAELKKAIADSRLHWRLRANSHLSLIRAHALNGEPQAALQCAEEAVALYPKDRMAWTYRGQVAAGMSNHHLAIESFVRALEAHDVAGAEATVLHMSDASLHHELAKSLAFTGRFAEAIQHFDQSIDNRQPADRKRLAQSMIVFLLFALGKRDEAKRRLSAESLIEETMAAIDSVAASTGNRDRVPDFCRWLESANCLTDAVRARLGQSARNPISRANELAQYARALRDRGDLIHSAIEFERAVALAPELPGLHYELGALYSAVGDSLRAAQAFVAELSINPKHALSAHDVGVLYAKDGDLREAANWFELCLTLDPTNEIAQKNLTEAKRCLAKMG
ncbi:MAG: tetratricopeptide repeat protein [Chloroflexi bacterium]|nr:tetratricopeptide repeat protein [Chloroflexota bacterium]